MIITKVLVTYAAIVTVMLVISGKLWFDTSNELAVTTESLRQQEVLSSSFEVEVKAQANRYAVLMRNRKVIQDKVYNQRVELDRYKGREDVVYAKAGLVERLEGKAMTKFFKSVESDDN
jgi:hypothetical protein